MFKKTIYLPIVFSTLLISACGGSSNNAGITQKSSDVSYTSASILAVEVNDAAAIDAGPEISSNGLELYFHSNRAGEGGFDLWVSTRANKMDNWGAATNLTATVNSTFDDKSPTLSDNGLTLIFTSNRTDGPGNDDLYISTRTSLITAWSPPIPVVGLINTVFNESAPSLSSDGRSLFFHSDAPGGQGTTDLYVSVRPSIGDPWDMPDNLGATVNSGLFDVAPEISSDGLSLYFHSTRTGGLGSHEIWRTTRTRATNPWSTPTVMPAPVNSTASDVGSSLSDDWQTLYFASDRGGNRDIWQAVP